jgi:hypothetical protein
VKCRGFRELHAPFLKERRTHGRVQGGVQEIRGICPVLADVGFHGSLPVTLYWQQALMLMVIYTLHTQGRCSCPGRRAGNSEYLARFSRDVDTTNPNL